MLFHAVSSQAVGKAKDGYGAARKTESEKKAELRAVQEKLKAAFTVLDEMSKARDEEGGGVNALFEEKKALHEEVRVFVRRGGAWKELLVSRGVFFGGGGGVFLTVDSCCRNLDGWRCLIFRPFGVALLQINVKIEGIKELRSVHRAKLDQW